ncbi:CPBP family intramembrane glutamic endopeptidase [Bacillus sp. S10(2024)]|uniref:CPBP family intramembrane glutamic endopeptidase n=1 Tax=Bacillus sp. S10(2024) TaxID=3162886 RepID=UPI003D240197
MEIKLQPESKPIVNDVKILLIYLFIFNFVWIFKELWLVQYIEPLSEVTSTFLNASIKILMWIFPVCLYIKYYLHTNPIKYLKMEDVNKGMFWGTFLLLLLGLYFIFEASILNDQPFKFKLSLNNYLNGILLVGITEEIVFRGFILQELNKRLSFWKANIITSFLFLIIHYAIWIYDGVFFDLWSHIYVFLIGIFFGLVFKKTGSLWSVVILHSFHNLFVSIM